MRAKQIVAYEVMQWVIPAKDDLGLDAHSALVLYQRGDLWVLDMESNRYGAENLKHFHQRAQSAAGRAHVCYPTVARQGVSNPDDFVCIGHFNEKGHPVLSTTLSQMSRARLDSYSGASFDDLLAQQEMLYPKVSYRFGR